MAPEPRISSLPRGRERRLGLSQSKRGGGGDRTWTDPLGDAEYRALGEFRQALRDFLAYSEAGAEEHGLSAQQHQALLAIRSDWGPSPMSIGELADCLLIKHHSAVGLVDRMAERGLISRFVSPTDRRRVLLQLTPEGFRILSDISVRNLARLSEASRSLSAVVRNVRRLERRRPVGPDRAAGQPGPSDET